MDSNQSVEADLTARATVPSAVRAATAAWIDIQDIDFDESRLLGKGAYGAVFRGSYKGHATAIKRGAVKTRDAQAQRYLAAELETLSSCGEHPNLLHYYGACLHGGYAYIVTEFCPGGDLASLLCDAAVDLPWSLRVKLARDAANGMACLHSRGLIHRDIKAENILLDDDWRAVLADYGFSRKVAGGQGGAPAAMTILGSAGAMAPEVLFGESYDQRADVYSFGTVLAHMLFRRTPGEGGFMERQARSKFALDLAELRAQCPADAPPSLVEACMQCLAYEPDDRLDSSLVLDWLTELVGDLGGEGVATGACGDKPSVLQARRRARKAEEGREREERGKQAES